MNSSPSTLLLFSVRESIFFPGLKPTLPASAAPRQAKQQNRPASRAKALRFCSSAWPVQPLAPPPLWAFWLRLRRWRSRSEEHTSELQSLMRISYAVFCLKKKKKANQTDDKTRTQDRNTK